MSEQLSLVQPLTWLLCEDQASSSSSLSSRRSSSLYSSSSLSLSSSFFQIRKIDTRTSYYEIPPQQILSTDSVTLTVDAVSLIMTFVMTTMMMMLLIFFKRKLYLLAGHILPSVKPVQAIIFYICLHLNSKL